MLEEETFLKERVNSLIQYTIEEGSSLFINKEMLSSTMSVLSGLKIARKPKPKLKSITNEENIELQKMKQGILSFLGNIQKKYPYAYSLIDKEMWVWIFDNVVK